MKITFLRHGRRNFTLGDVPLNEQGLQEARSLATNPALQDVETILSSPKLRSLMTIEPLSIKLQRKPIIQESLDQMRSGESESIFHDRVENFLKKLEQGTWASPILLCSHSDWLSMAVSIIPTDALNLPGTMFDCSEFMTFEIKQGIWTLQ